MTISREVLAKYITPGCTFIETGTRWGDTAIAASQLGAGLVWTAEWDPLFAGIARSHTMDAQFRSGPIVVHGEDGRGMLELLVRYGDGSTWHVQRYPEIVKTEILVFLDAHTDSESSVLPELSLISQWPCKPRAILIDDLRCMEGWGISLADLVAAVLSVGDYQIGYEDGVEKGDIMACVRA